jgi:hypothetical protein
MSMWPSTVAQAYNPSCLEGGDREDGGLRTAYTKSLQNTISTNGWAQWHKPVIPAMQESTNWRITGWPRQKARPYLKSNQL